MRLRGSAELRRALAVRTASRPLLLLYTSGQGHCNSLPLPVHQVLLKAAAVYGDEAKAAKLAGATPYVARVGESSRRTPAVVDRIP